MTYDVRNPVWPKALSRAIGLSGIALASSYFGIAIRRHRFASNYCEILIRKVVLGSKQAAMAD